MRCLRKGSLWASFLFVSVPCAAAADDAAPMLPATAVIQHALDLHLDQHPVWQALLHIEQKKARIQDPNFLLSEPRFSARQELIASLQQLLIRPDQTQCRFPARDVWLRQQLQLPTVSYQQCADLQEFLKKAPMDTLSVVYAAENLNSASSMMGHVLFKLTGTRADGKVAEHAISFYTEVKGINLPKIMYDSVVVGKKGFFALSPYHEKIQYYTQHEQRNVWIYDIALTPAQRQLIQYHLWELKQTELRYFFTSYNCATFSNIVLALTNHPVLSSVTGWQSPLDVVKHIHRADLVQRTQFYPSARARVRMLTEQQPSAWQQQIDQAVAAGDFMALPPAFTEIDDYRRQKVAQALLHYRTETQDKPLSATQQQLQQHLQTGLNTLDQQFQLDLDDYKSPLKTPADSQWYIDWQSSDQQPDHLRVGAFAASHRIEDDQRQALSNSELRLADLALSWQPQQQRLRVDHFDLYAMSSFVPYDPLTGGISTRFRLGYRQQTAASLDRYAAVYMQGGLGRTYAITPDLHAYVLLNIGIDNRGDHPLQLQPEFGLIINAVYDMKSIVTMQHTTAIRSNTDSDTWAQATWTHAIPLNAAYRLVLDSQYVWNQNNDDTRVSIGIKHLF